MFAIVALNTQSASVYSYQCDMTIWIDLMVFKIACKNLRQRKSDIRGFNSRGVRLTLPKGLAFVPGGFLHWTMSLAWMDGAGEGHRGSA